MKIDFERVEVFTDLEKKNCTVLNMRKPLANMLYQHGSGLACHALAMRLWNTEGECELDEDERGVVLRLVEQVCTPSVIDAVRVKLEVGN